MKNVCKASVTKALKILEDGGFIIRVTDEKDRRNALCYVSEKGEEIVHELLVIKTNVEAEIFKGFTEQDKDIFYCYLSRIYNNSAKLGSGLGLKGDED